MLVIMPVAMETCGVYNKVFDFRTGLNRGSVAFTHQPNCNRTGNFYLPCLWLNGMYFNTYNRRGSHLQFHLGPFKCLRNGACARVKS